MSLAEVRDKIENAKLRREWQTQEDISSIKRNQELQTVKLFDNERLDGDGDGDGDGSYITSNIIKIDKRTTDKFTILITSDNDCMDLAVVYRVSMDNITYFPLNSNFRVSYSEGKTIQAVIKDFIPRYMQIKIINSGSISSNISGYVNY